MLSKAFGKFYVWIFILPFLVNPWALNIYGAVKLSFFLLFLATVFAYLAGRAVIVGKVDFVWKREFGFWLLAALVFALISTLLSDYLILSFFGDYSYMRGLLFYGLLAVHFFICVQIFRNKDVLNYFSKFLKVFAVVICVHALGQLWNWDLFTDVDNAQYLFRIYGNIGQPNFLAQFLIFPLVFVALETWERRSWPNFLLLALLLTTVVFTHSRASILALGFGFYFWLYFFSGVKRKAKILFTLLALLGLVFLALFADFEFRSLYSRWYLWTGSLEIIDWGNLFFGNGFNSFESLYAQVLPAAVFNYEQFYTTPSYPHNLLLQILIEQGLLALGFYGFLAFYLARIVWQKRKKSYYLQAAFLSLLIYIVSVQFSFSTLEHHLYFVAILAILLNQLFKVKKHSIKLEKVGSFCSFFVVFFVAALLLFYLAQLVFFADVKMGKVIELYFVNKGQSEKLLDEVKNELYFYDEPREFALTLFHEKEDLEVYKVIRAEDFKYLSRAVKYYAKQGDLEMVGALADDLIAAGPNLPTTYTSLGDAYFDNDSCEEAMKYYGKLFDLAPAGIEDDPEKYRLFVKHASAYLRAKNNFQSCALRSINQS